MHAKKNTLGNIAIRVLEFSSGVYKIGKIFCLKINIPKGILRILRIGLMGKCQKLDIILESKVIQKLMLSKNVNSPNSIISFEYVDS